MPLPKPHDNEMHEDWMDRCMSDPMMASEFEDGEQRTAVCSTMWRDRNKGGKVARKRIEFFDCPFECKQIGEDGAFEGYAAVFNNKDRGGDIVRPDAFKDFEYNEDGKITVLWQHNTRDPVGVAAVAQDKMGLAFDGMLVLEDPTARKARAHMKAKSVRGMSIGYDVLEGGEKLLDDGTRELTSLKLWEVSIVTFPMNPLARVLDAKGALEKVTDIRELEDLLREVVGLSRSQAKLHAGAIWATKTGQREADGEVAATLQRMTERLRSI